MSIGKAANDNVVPAFGPFPPTMKIAKVLGSKYYFTGKPCLRGHVAARYAHGSCTACKAENREANREFFAAQSREWRRENPDKAKAQGYSDRKRETMAAYYERTREHQIEKALAWNKANPERAREINLKWKEANPDYSATRWARMTPEERETARLQVSEWRENNREQYNDNSKRWRRENPEKIAAIDRNKRAKRKSAEGKHTAADVQKLIANQKNKCAECGKSLLVTGYHVDHIMPLVLGGTNWPWNLQILCPACNLEKHATDPFVFAQRKGRLF